jgi:plasmid stabilization system protein ParE
VIHRLTRDAQADLREALRWYRLQAAGLDQDLLDCFDDCLAMIERFPEAFPVVHEGVRRAPMPRFPYAVLYTAEADSLLVRAVWHTGRDPRVLARRVR